jgi:hypothetical protein
MRYASLKVFGVALVVVACAGCATTEGGGGMSDEEAITTIMNQFKENMIAMNLDQAFTLVADDFEMSDGLGKDEYKEFLTQLKDAGQFDGMTIALDTLQVAVDGESATAKPMTVTGAFGTATLEFELEKREGAWIVTYINQVVG